MKLRLLAILLAAGLFTTACSDEEAYTAAVEEPTKAAVEEPTKAAVEEVKKAAAPVVEEKSAAEKAFEGPGTLHTVKMLNSGKNGIMVFEPGFLKINKGDTVYFEATDAGHDAVASYTPDGNHWYVGFQGGKVQFNAEGVHIYYCTPHKSMAMYGVIQVGEATNKAEAMAAAEKSEAGFAMNQGRLLGYMDQVVK